MGLARTAGLITILVLAAGAARGDSPQPAPRPDGPKVVLRVSRVFLGDLAGRQVDQSDPLSLVSGRATVVGTTRVSLDTRVRLDPDAGASEFDFVVRGSMTKQSVTSRRSVRVRASGSADIGAARRVSFDGESFVAAPVAADVSYQQSLDGITTTRNGLAAPLVRRIARPIAQRKLNETAPEAEGQIRSQIDTEMTRETDRIVEVLNDVVGVTRQVTDMLREAGIPVGRAKPVVRVTDAAILVGIGFADGEIPDLPSGASLQAPVEIWLSQTLTPREERRFQELRPAAERLWADHVRPHARALLVEHTPRLVEVLDAARHEVVLDPVAGDARWHVIRFGKELHHD